MACSICGSTRHEVTTGGCPKQGMGVVEYERFLFPPVSIGWACPVCNKGNAPDVKGCAHCAESAVSKSAFGELYEICTNEPDPQYRKIAIRKEKNMHPGG